MGGSQCIHKNAWIELQLNFLDMLQAVNVIACVSKFWNS